MRGLIYSAAMLFCAAPAFAQQGGGVVQSGSVTAGDCVSWKSTNIIQDAGAACGGGSSTLTANSTATSGFTSGQYLYSDGSKLQAGSFGANVQTALGLTLNGSGALAATTSPTFVTPVLGAAAATSLVLNSNANLVAPTANELDLQNGTSTQKLCVFNTYSSGGANCEKACLYYNANVLTLDHEFGGTGAARNAIFNFGLGSLRLQAANVQLLTAGGTLSATLTPSSNGIFYLADNTGAAFARMGLGGVTSSYPALARFGNALQGWLGSGAVPAFSTLTACGSSGEGAFTPVSDSTTATWGATVTGGGANHVWAYCDGTNWTVAASSAGGALTTAAFTAIGTSGATIPLLSTANTWTSTQNMLSGVTLGADTHLLYDVNATTIGGRIGAAGPFFNIRTVAASNIDLNNASGGNVTFSSGGTLLATVNTSGNVAATCYTANGSAGVSCAAGISATTGRAVNGIITAC